MAKKIKLQDLLFVDHRRLNHYAEIIAGSPTIIEKGRKFGVKFSITSIEVSAEQPETRRQRTTLENMAKVRSYLEDQEELHKARPGKVDLDCLFVFEQCSLHKVEVPKIVDGPNGAPKLTFWLSPTHERAQEKAPLCLLEDFSKSDGEVNSLISHSSAYTILESLIYYTRGRLEETYLGRAILNDPYLNRLAGFDNNPSAMSKYHDVKDLCFEFIADPERLLRLWNCRVSAPRPVETLYRIRENGPDYKQANRISIFGYPLWIATAA
jgi:hypothetical protein